MCAAVGAGSVTVCVAGLCVRLCGVGLGCGPKWERAPESVSLLCVFRQQTAPALGWGCRQQSAQRLAAPLGALCCCIGLGPADSVSQSDCSVLSVLFVGAAVQTEWDCASVW